MFTDKNRNPIRDGDSYVSEDGTQYPRNFPKTEIPGLFKVNESKRPTDPNLVVMGFEINTDHDQVWMTRVKDEFEIENDRNEAKNALIQEAKNKLAWTDQVALRCIKAGVPFCEAWMVYVAGLRLVVSSDLSEMPTPPMDESGNVAYPKGS